MAKATKEEAYTIHLELSKREAEYLRALISVVGCEPREAQEIRLAFQSVGLNKISVDYGGMFEGSVTYTGRHLDTTGKHSVY